MGMKKMTLGYSVVYIDSLYGDVYMHVKKWERFPRPDITWIRFSIYGVESSMY